MIPVSDQNQSPPQRPSSCRPSRACYQKVHGQDLPFQDTWSFGFNLDLSLLARSDMRCLAACDGWPDSAD
ncbi:unnamed protein product [Zymoseptoria tritici ST99CH_3D7]|uniref:Uncharacterized protein n=1 Tax=Zymoseptoria tritici (strain ST99CH_3D7) TaxID=1276538 RepID=A0A1X7REG3_ZYMT9|nr:unnamed protein product [Zymoseptoria tritici ST99CH_3D7]